MIDEQDPSAAQDAQPAAFAAQRLGPHVDVEAAGQVEQVVESSLEFHRGSIKRAGGDADNSFAVMNARTETRRSVVDAPGADQAQLDRHLDLLERGLGDLQLQVRRLQKLAAMGTMSAVLAHEFNNLLTPIVGYAQHALQQSDADRMRTALEKTLAHAQRAALLCAKVMGMACDDRMGPEPTPLRPLMEDTIACLGRDLEKDGIEARIDVDPGLVARVHAASLQQALFNLVLNARQALLGRRGRMEIAARRSPEGDLLIGVRDNGPGIRPEMIESIFEPFFTTRNRPDRPDRRGLGLGLTISRQLIEELGGRLTVESRYGHGAEFTIRLPAGE